MKPEIEAVIEKPRIPKGDGRIVYVAGPYKAETEEKKCENIWHAIKVAVRLWELNWVVFSPILNSAHFEIYSSLPEEVYLEGDLKFLEFCSAIMLLKGWEQSKGAKRELEVATERGMDIFYE